MRIALIHDAVFPVEKYGGTERVVWWLAKGLAEKGHHVSLVARPGSHFPYGDFIPHDFRTSVTIDSDVLHCFATPPVVPDRPYIVTIGGNGRRGERFLRNTVFVSKNHAARHHAEAYVHNGVDPDEYEYSTSKGNSLLFLAKASWRTKNLRGAIRIARRARCPLNILGGSRSWLPYWRGVHYRGLLGGERKKSYLSSACGLLFPVIWNEPFGIAVIEALISGTPILASRRGSLPELVAPGVGFLCDTYDEFIRRVPELASVESSRCRDLAMSCFTYRHMASSYIEYYVRVANGECLNERDPFTDEPQGLLLELGCRDT